MGRVVNGHGQERGAKWAMTMLQTWRRRCVPLMRAVVREEVVVVQLYVRTYVPVAHAAAAAELLHLR